MAESDTNSVHLLREKLEHLRIELVRAADPAMKFSIQKGIEEAERMLAQLNHAQPLNSNSDDDSGGLAVATDTDVVDIELTIKADFEHFSEADKDNVLKAIDRLLDISSVRLVRRRRGSVKLTFRVRRKDAERLFDAVMLGELDDVNVSDARILSELVDKQIELAEDEEETPESSPLRDTRTLSETEEEINWEDLPICRPRPRRDRDNMYALEPRQIWQTIGCLACLLLVIAAVVYLIATQLLFRDL